MAPASAADNQKMERKMNEVIEMEPSAIQAAPQQSQGRIVTQATPADLMRYALESGADLDRLEKLMQMQLAWEANEARKAYVAAMAEFKKNPPEIFKDKHVSFDTQKGRTEYDHATIGNVVERVVAALAEHGFSHRWVPGKTEAGLMKVTCVITHRLGHSEETTLEGSADQSGGKNSIQAVASTNTYLQRYSLLMACGLATKDAEYPDDDGRGAGEQEKTIVRQQLSGKAFDKAIASIKAGEWTLAEIEKHYELTVDQKTAAQDAAKERK
jgi:hypothetical protein